MFGHLVEKNIKEVKPSAFFRSPTGSGGVGQSPLGLELPRLEKQAAASGVKCQTEELAFQAVENGVWPRQKDHSRVVWRMQWENWLRCPVWAWYWGLGEN